MRLPTAPEVAALQGVAMPQASLVDALPHPAWIVGLPALRVVAANAAAAQLLGASAADLVGRAADELIASPEDLAYWDEVLAGHAPAPLLSQTVVCTADGRTLAVERSIGPLGVGGVATACLVMVVDRSADRRADDERERTIAELQATLEATADGILVTDLAGRIRAFNRRFAQMWALPDDLLQGRDDPAIEAWMARSVVDGEAYRRRLAAVQESVMMTGSERLRLHSGQVFERVTRPLWWRGRPQGRVWSFRDLTERLAAEERIETLSTTDPLTKLPNRRQLAECVAKASVRARAGGPGFALLLVDLDRFRQINDSMGTDFGDRVLLEVGRRIQKCLRQGDLLAHLGADHFAVLLHGAAAPAAEAAARRVLATVGQPCELDRHAFTLTCSIGVAMHPGNGRDLDELMRHAELAMRAAKEGGRAGWRFHQPRADVDFRMQMRLDHAMRQALVAGRFRLNYQPQVSLADGRVVGAEALIRWRDPELGEVPPDRFIPVAEDSGFIVEIGRWVLSQAVRQAALWHERGRALSVAVNVSALQFQQPQFVDEVAQVLAVSRLPAHLLELELTESILLRNADEAHHRLQALARLGVQLSIDDFGTGYSSFEYLRRIEIDKLKIDRSFIKRLPGDAKDVAIVRAILQMARALEMRVVAEGVETELQRQFLLDAGCEAFQGFLFARPMDALSFEQRVAGLLRDDPATA